MPLRDSRINDSIRNAMLRQGTFRGSWSRQPVSNRIKIGLSVVEPVRKAVRTRQVSRQSVGYERLYGLSSIDHNKGSCVQAGDPLGGIDP